MKNVTRSGDRLEEDARRSLSDFAILCLLDAEQTESELAQGLDQLGLTFDDTDLRSGLRRLERRGLLRSHSPKREAHRRYTITDEGRRTRVALEESWLSNRRVLDVLLVAAQCGPKEISGTSPVEGERASLVVERQELDRLRNDLLSTISHELRTPLTLVRTSIGLLLDADPDAVMRERLLRNIKQSADRMHMLVTDLLDLVRLRSGHAELRMRYLDVKDLVAEAGALMRPLLDEKGQVLDVDVPSPGPRIMGDHRRLEQVLLNLLSNANKFAPRGARVCISVVEDGTSVTIRVSDTGPGISPEEQAHLFEQFYTARTSSPSHNIGVGLGLPIAKGIVEAHGGRIWVESQVGLGTTVHVSIPKDGPIGGGTGEDTGGRRRS